jgi:regulation of enolase protein 1 (concanavalin A-like superfamily)
MQEVHVTYTDWAIQNNFQVSKVYCEIKLRVSRKQSQITVELCSDRFCFVLSIVLIEFPLWLVLVVH